MKTQGRLAALLFALLATACTSGAEVRSAAASHAELTARTLMAVWESGDAEDLPTLFHPNGSYEDFSNQLEYRGIQEIATYVGSVNRWATDVSLFIGAVHAGESSATVEWTLSGVQDRPIPGLVGVATNREFFLNGVTIIMLDEGLIIRAADYIDVTPLLLQLGATITLPDGEVMGMDDVGGA